MELLVVLLVAGLALILLETILPGMVAGVIGTGCLAAGVVLAYLDFGPRVGNFVLFGVLGALLVAGLLWIRFFPHSRLGQTFVTRRTVGLLGVDRPELLNRTGTALTNLRPAGTARIGDQRVDVVTEGDLIPRGTAVKVVAVEGFRIVVRAVTD